VKEAKGYHYTTIPHTHTKHLPTTTKKELH